MAQPSRSFLSRKLASTALPMVFVQVAYSSMGFIDTLLLGQLGVEDLAGGGLGTTVFQFFHIVALGVLIAVANHIAYARGAGEYEQIHQALLSGVVAVFVLFMCFGLVMAFSKPILLSFGQEEKVAAIAETYLDIALWAMLPAQMFVLLRSLVLGMGKAVLILPVSLAGAALNYPVSYALMTGQFGLPEMGIEGIALGSVIVSFLMFFGLVWLTYRDASFRPFPFWRGWSIFSFQQLKATFNLGVPIAIAHAMEIGLFSMAAILIGWVSIEALAANQIAIQLTALTFMIPLGISQAVSVQVGEYYGARDWQSVRMTVQLGLMVVTLTACCSATAFFLVPEFLGGLFLDPSMNEVQQVLGIVAGILFVAALFQWVDGYQVVLMGALRGFKLGASPTWAAVFCYWCIGLPISWWAREPYGAVGVWSGMGIGLAAAAVCLLLLYRRFLRQQDLS